jgi:histone chaperone ASF1
VGSAHDSQKDQILDEILVGPIPVGLNKFVLQADPPAIDQLPPDEILGVTVVLVTCSYREKEFVRVGYYLNNLYTGEYDESTGPPSLPNLDLTLVQRQILADKPRVTKFPISWGNENDVVVPVQQEQPENLAAPPTTTTATDSTATDQPMDQGTPMTVSMGVETE